MFVPLVALPLALQLIAVADGVPNLNVKPSCEGAAKSGYISTTEDRLKSCIDSEMQTRKKLEQDWPQFPTVDRVNCMDSIKGFQPTYSELATCLEMKRDLRNTRPADAVNAPAVKPASKP
jgi:hypothetical protein